MKGIFRHLFLCKLEVAWQPCVVVVVIMIWHIAKWSYWLGLVWKLSRHISDSLSPPGSPVIMTLTLKCVSSFVVRRHTTKTAFWNSDRVPTQWRLWILWCGMINITYLWMCIWCEWIYRKLKNYCAFWSLNEVIVNCICPVFDTWWCQLSADVTQWSWQICCVCVGRLLHHRHTSYLFV